MRLALGRPRTALIVAPHPDDEVIGAAGLIRVLRRQGSRVQIVIVSDGAASHDDSPRWPARRRIMARRYESRRALARLGVSASAISFLDLPDGRLTDLADRCRRSIGRAIRRCRDLDLVVGPTPHDGHPDHRAVARAIAGHRHAARSIGYRIWPPQPLRAARAQRLVGAGGAAAKRSIIRLFRTQTGAIRDAPGGFAIARHELDSFSSPIERFAELRR